MFPARTCRNLESASASSRHCSYPRDGEAVIARVLMVAMARNNGRVGE